MITQLHIGIVGYGNVGWNLHQAFLQSGFQHVDISSNSNGLSGSFKPISSLLNKDMIFICTNDDSMDERIAELEEYEGMLIHCSGSKALINKPQAGVFYPFQTFTKGTNVDWKHVPVFIESESEEVRMKLSELAQSIAGKSYQVDHNQRLALHISGVFGANFVNYILLHASEVLKRNELPFEVMQPLLNETIRKAFELGPASSQTGPAKRHDIKTLQKHLLALEESPESKGIYDYLSNLILERHKR